MSEVDHWDFVLCSITGTLCFVPMVFLARAVQGGLKRMRRSLCCLSLCSLTHALTRALAYADGTVLGEAVGLRAHLFLGPLPLPEKRPSPQ